MPSKEARRDLGTGALYQRSSDGMWIGSVSLPERDGKRRRKYVSARSKADASSKLRELRKELDQQGDLPTSSTTVARWMETWLGHMKKDMRPTAWKTYQRQSKYIVAAIGKKRLDRLSASDVRRVTAYMTDDLGLSATTAANVHGVLKQALIAARADGKTVPDAGLAVKRPKRAAGTRGALTADQARDVLKVSADDGAAFVSWSLALLLGMRQGERLGLTRNAIDLDARTLTVEWQMQRIPWEHGCGAQRDQVWPCGYSRAAWCPKRRVEIPQHHEAKHLVDALWLLRPKTATGKRQLPIPEPLAVALERYLEQSEPGMAGLVLHRENGRPWEPSVDREMWHSTLALAGVPAVPLHSARHTTATLLREMGVPEDVRMQILGHADEQTTAGYTHLAKTEAVDAMRRLGELVLPEE